MTERWKALNSNGVALVYQNPADAAYVARAVNSHDMLVETIREVMNILSEPTADLFGKAMSDAYDTLENALLEVADK